MRKFFVLLAVLLVTSAPLPAQQGTSALGGRVLDQLGAILPGVGVLARNQDTGMFRETISTEDGSFFFSGMVPGRYQIEAELQGFKKYQRKDVALEVGKNATLDVVLEVGSFTEEVVVTAESPIVDVTSKEVGGYIQNRELVDLPSVNRNFVGYLGLLPGVVASISTASFGADSVNVNGQSVRNTNYALDGADNNDSFNAGNGGAQARIPIEAVQEFQMLVSQFDAEFGRTSGGVVNAVTKQGANQIHGSVFSFFQDSALTAKDYFARTRNLTKPDTQVKQYGGTVGGPIVRDRAHYFASIERVSQNRGVTINIPARPEFNSAEFTRDRVWNLLGRFDHQINAKNTWSLRYLREMSPQFNQFNNTSTTKAANDEERDIDFTYVGTLTSVLNPRTLNTFRMTATQEDVTFGNPGFMGNGRRQAELKPTLAYLTFRDQQSARASSRLDRAFGADETFSWFVPDKMGSHDLKFGAQYLYTGLRFGDSGNLNGTFTSSGNLTFDRANPRTYPDRFSIRVPGPLSYFLKGHFMSVFAQDKWKVNRKATLSVGVRYDVEVVPIPEVDNPAFKSPGDYPIDKNNVSPRLGFSYALDDSNRSVVRGGYGLFFQKTPFTFLSGLISNGVFSDSFVVTFPANQADPGPSQGRLPTNPLLINGPTVDRTLLSQMFPSGSRQKNSGIVQFDTPDRRLAYSQQLSGGFERQLAANIAVSADLVHTRNRAQFMRRDLNPGTRVNTSRTGTVRRVNPNFVQSVFQIQNIGWIDYDALQVQVEKRFSGLFSLRGSYTLAKGRGNTDQGNNETLNFQYLDDPRLDREKGPTSIDRRHNLVISGTMEIPRTRGLRISGVARALSGTPFTIQDSNTDPDQNGILFDPIAPGSYSGAGADAITVENAGGRNGAYGPGYFQLDLRMGYKFNVRERVPLEVFGEIFNATNRANFNTPAGDRRSTNFLRVTSIRGGGPTRSGQLGLRFSW